METFVPPKSLSVNPHFTNQKRQSRMALKETSIDAPIADIVTGFNRYACCFTLQSCFGHFLDSRQRDIPNLSAIPATAIGDELVYRIAYLAVCIEDSVSGRRLLDALAAIPAEAPQWIQFGSADWFWQQQINSYVLQVEPVRFKCQDTTHLAHEEAVVVQHVRNTFFDRLRELIPSEKG